MKSKLLLILTVLTAASYAHAVANPVKIGYVNLEYVMGLLPDTKKFETDFKAFEGQVRKQLEQKATEFQEKFQSYQEGHATMTDAVKSQKEEELRQIQTDFDKLQTESQNSLARKQLELGKPIYDKIQKAIEAVAKEQKFTHVLNADAAGMHIILYAEKEYNVSDLVLRKLGVDPVKAAKEILEKAAAQKAATQGAVKRAPEVKKAPQTGTQNKK